MDPVGIRLTQLLTGLKKRLKLSLAINIVKSIKVNKTDCIIRMTKMITCTSSIYSSSALSIVSGLGLSLAI